MENVRELAASRSILSAAFHQTQTSCCLPVWTAHRVTSRPSPDVFVLPSACTASFLVATALHYCRLTSREITGRPWNVTVHLPMLHARSRSSMPLYVDHVEVEQSAENDQEYFTKTLRCPSSRRPLIRRLVNLERDLTSSAPLPLDNISEPSPTLCRLCKVANFKQSSMTFV
ncbi:hypothetical protein PsorP6_011372 [Peronosclerospora sorghi]|uniref:Uncharacterized protein n=1 Tax=Peronosclerospora sorghi TaxID=230839 RepID=A0ACC0WLT5_9STRA|nr:hypothetical protein PsorP6_011372 [Peronosclerospora sorghi]